MNRAVWRQVSKTSAFKIRPPAVIICRALLLAIPMQLQMGGRALAATVNVEALSSLRFWPETVTIKVGDNVRWTHLGTSHNVEPFCGQLPVPGGACIKQFNTPGTFNYFCQQHRFLGMVGTVIVQGATTPPPSTTITSPANGAVFAAPADVKVQAIASAPTATIARVDFLMGAWTAGTDASPPYSIVVSNLAAGYYALRAVATDTGGLSSTSAVVNFSVVEPVSLALAQPLISNGRFQLSFTANAGLRYVIENSPNLATWTAGTTRTASSAFEKVEVPFSVNIPQFYRVRRLPNP